MKRTKCYIIGRELTYEAVHHSVARRPNTGLQRRYHF